MTDIRLSEDQLSQLAKQIAAHGHTCRFGDDEAQEVHRFAQEMRNGGRENFAAVLAFGETLRQARKVGTGTLVVTLVGAIVGALWVGIKIAIQRQ